MKSFALITLAIFFLSSVQENVVGERNKALKLVFAVFRHGDKTNDYVGPYPKNPHKNQTYYPYGRGQLTNKGREKAYMLGKILRKRYNSFLGEIYNPGLLYAVSSHYPRTKTTLQLVLAALYPPKGTTLEWNTGLNWQPIAYDLFSNDLLEFAMLKCPKFINLYNQFINTPEGQVIEKKYRSWFQFISGNTGLVVKQVFDLFFLYFKLECDDEWGLTLPDWTNKVYPKYLRSAVKDFYLSSANDSERKRLSGGFILSEMMEKMRLKISGVSNTQSVFLYSGHEYNVVYAMHALNVYYSHIPKYGACLLVELHQYNKTYGVKISYLEGPKGKPRSLIIPGCEEFCEFSKFETLLKDNIGNDTSICLTY